MSPDQPSQQVTNRDDLSLFYLIVRTVIRPFRPQLVRPPKTPAGSMKLEPPRCRRRVEERHDNSLYFYHLHPPSFHADHKLPKHRLYYFAGGGFQSPPSKDHWKLCDDLAHQLSELYEIIVVSPPLAPLSPAPQALPLLQKWLSEILRSIDKAGTGGKVTLMGDSSGGNLALSLGFWWAKQEEAKSNSALKNLLAISPAVDLTNTNPQIDEADKYDPVLTKKLTDDVAKTWAASMPRGHPEVSPIHGDFDCVRDANIKVHGVIGSHDCLAPDATKFRKMCDEHGIAGEWLEWEGQMHCFPLIFRYGIREGIQAKDWIAGVLRRNV